MNGEAERRAVWLSWRIGQEVQATRRTLGWSQRGLGVRAGVPQSTVWRIEHGSRHANIETLCRITTALALDLNVRAFPSTRVRIRDERQLARIGFITARASTLWHPQLEVRVTPDPADARAIDLVLSSAVEVVAVEVEGDLADFQAQLRRDLASGICLRRESLVPSGSCLRSRIRGASAGSSGTMLPSSPGRCPHRRDTSGPRFGRATLSGEMESCGCPRAPRRCAANGVESWVES